MCTWRICWSLVQLRTRRNSAPGRCSRSLSASAEQSFQWAPNTRRDPGFLKIANWRGRVGWVLGAKTRSEDINLGVQENCKLITNPIPTNLLSSFSWLHQQKLHAACAAQCWKYSFYQLLDGFTCLSARHIDLSSWA